MIPENATPTMAGLVPPSDDEEAAARVAELVSNGIKEGLVGALFANIDQLQRALREAGFFFVLEKKKPWRNLISTTYFSELTSKADGSIYLLLINCLGETPRILNCVQTGAAKAPAPEETPLPSPQETDWTDFLALKPGINRNPNIHHGD